MCLLFILKARAPSTVYSSGFYNIRQHVSRDVPYGFPAYRMEKEFRQLDKVKSVLDLSSFASKKDKRGKQTPSYAVPPRVGT